MRGNGNSFKEAGEAARFIEVMYRTMTMGSGNGEPDPTLPWANDLESFSEEFAYRFSEGETRIYKCKPQDVHFAYQAFSRIAVPWQQCGLPILELSKSAAAAMLLTDPGRLTLPTPFPAFGLRVPQETLPSISVDGMMLVWFDARTSAVTVNGFGRGKSMWCGWETMEEMWSGDVPHGQGVRSDVVKDMRVLARLLASTLAWWSTFRPTDTQAKRLCYSRQDKRERSQSVVWRIGKGVDLGKVGLDEAREVTQALRNGRARDEGRRIEQQHVVRGHFRHQRVGAGRAKTKTVWIQPYIRGPEAEEAWSSVYKIRA
jgi:hypothetical protein